MSFVSNCSAVKKVMKIFLLNVTIIGIMLYASSWDSIASVRTFADTDTNNHNISSSTRATLSTKDTPTIINLLTSSIASPNHSASENNDWLQNYIMMVVYGHINH
jgi:hypothetical protein